MGGMQVLVTTTLVVVLFTTIVLGGVTMPLMKYLEKRMGSSRYRYSSRFISCIDIIIYLDRKRGGGQHVFVEN